MLTFRPFRNDDPATLLMLWQKEEAYLERKGLMSLTMNFVQVQVLGLPFLDRHSILLAHDDDIPVGYIHVSFGPGGDGSGLSRQTGHICYLCVDRCCRNPVEVAKLLIREGEKYLFQRGSEEVFGGSPHLSAPFYTGFHGGGESIGFFDSETHLTSAFLTSDYKLLTRTSRFHLDLRNYKPPITSKTVGWRSELYLEFDDAPRPKNWWEACAMANFDWLQVTAIHAETNRPIARVRVRVANPETTVEDLLYNRTWDASLIDIRVHPEYHGRGIGIYTLGETLRHLTATSQVSQIEAHISDDVSYLSSILLALNWSKVDSGNIFYKNKIL
ncbi:MAG: hypothetical protein ACRCUY_07330 [Thermoguttaceae bacterium]